MRLDVRSTLRISMPIKQFQTIGNFNKSHSFKKNIDRVLLTNPKSVQKIQSKFLRTSVPFSLFFLNQPGAGKYSETGAVDPSWIEQNLGLTLGRDLVLDPDSINIIFTNNDGGDRVMMTAWIIAHRISHVFDAASRKYSRGSYRVGDLYEKINEWVGRLVKLSDRSFGVGVGRNSREPSRALRNFLYEIGTFKTARERNLTNPNEFIHECFAQYLLQGQVKFRAFPKSITTRFNWGKPNKSFQKYEPDMLQRHENDQRNQMELDNLCDEMNWYFEDMLNTMVGHTFVM